MSDTEWDLDAQDAVMMPERRRKMAKVPPL